MRRAEASAVVARMKTRSSYDWLSITQMKVDHRFQRLLRKAWVKRHEHLFDANQIGTIVVSRRSDGSLWIIDGQHRVELLRAVGWGDQALYCEIFDCITLQEEAAIFLSRNDKITPRAFDEFKARLTKGDEDALAIQRIVTLLDLKINEGQTEGSVSAVRALEYIHGGGRTASQKDGAIALGKTLQAIVGAWGKAAANFQGQVIEGLGLVFLRYGKRVDPQQMASKLSKIGGGASGLIGQAKALRDLHGGGLAYAVGGVIVQRYNRGLRTAKLDTWWK
jgi:hypothetical protein